jgi:hypothetical protein
VADTRRERPPRRAPEERRHLHVMVATWTGVVAGTLTLAATVLIWRPWAPNPHGTDRLKVDVSSQSGAKAFDVFMRGHDGSVAYLDIACSEYNDGSEKRIAAMNPAAHCLFQEMDNYSDESPKAMFLSTFSHSRSARSWWSGPESALRPEESDLWTYFPEKPEASSAFFGNYRGSGNNGAGGLEVKGYFRVVATGTGSLGGPPGIDNVDLRPVNAPTN